MNTVLRVIEQAFGPEAQARLSAREYNQLQDSEQLPLQEFEAKGFTRRADRLVANYPELSNTVDTLRGFVAADELITSSRLRAAIGYAGLHFVYVNHVFGGEYSITQ